MIAFEVNDMTCGHCVRAITEAVQSADNGARVQVDLATHRVQIEPVAAQASALLHAIQQRQPAIIEAPDRLDRHHVLCCAGHVRQPRR